MIYFGWRGLWVAHVLVLYLYYPSILFRTLISTLVLNRIFFDDWKTMSSSVCLVLPTIYASTFMDIWVPLKIYYLTVFNGNTFLNHPIKNHIDAKSINKTRILARRPRIPKFFDLKNLRWNLGVIPTSISDILFTFLFKKKHIRSISLNLTSVFILLSTIIDAYIFSRISWTVWP